LDRGGYRTTERSVCMGNPVETLQAMMRDATHEQAKALAVALEALGERQNESQNRVDAYQAGRRDERRDLSKPADEAAEREHCATVVDKLLKGPCREAHMRAGL